MLQKDKNLILKEIKTCNHKPSDYKRTVNQNGTYSIFTIERINTPFFFTINTPIDDRNKHICTYTEYKSDFPTSKEHPSFSRENTAYILNQFRGWVYNHINPYLEDSETPDLWEEIENQFIFACKYDTYQDIFENKKLDNKDKKYIEISLIDIQKKILESYEVNTDQINDIKIKMDYLIESVDHLKKPDWKGIFLSSMIGIATNLCVDTNGVHDFYTILKKQFEK